MMKFAVPAIWFAIAAGVYVYNQGEQGQVVMWGINFFVGEDPVARGNATVALAAAIGVFTSIGPIASLFQKNPDDSAEE
jgi:hypothetical protein